MRKKKIILLIYLIILTGLNTLKAEEGTWIIKNNKVDTKSTINLVEEITVELMNLDVQEMMP